MVFKKVLHFSTYYGQEFCTSTGFPFSATYQR